MRKILLGILVVIMISTIGNVVEANRSRSERMIRVYGTVTIDGNGVEGADIVVKNLDRDYEETTKTNSSGYYEIFIKAVDNNKIKVNVNFDEYNNDKSFVLEKFKSNYEIDFEFESTPDVQMVKKIHGFFDRLKDVSFRAVMFDCLLFLLIVCILVSLHQWHREIKKDKD